MILFALSAWAGDGALWYASSSFSLTDLESTLLAAGATSFDSRTAPYDRDGDGYDSLACGGADCDDRDATVSPDAVWYADADADGFGDASAPTSACDAGSVDDATDCDDADADAFPGAPELCDGEDDDCDGAADDDPVDGVTAYLDADADGYGSTAEVVVTCEALDGYVDNVRDCDDTSAAVYPDAAEVCDDRDNDCDGGRDEDAVDASDWYADADEDGFGDGATGVVACAAPEGRVPDGTDCDDDDSWIPHGADEYCDDLDGDCDGTVDEDPVQAADWWADADADGFGDPGEATAACDAPEGFVDNDFDCDDADAARTLTCDEEPADPEVTGAAEGCGCRAAGGASGLAGVLLAAALARARSRGVTPPDGRLP